MELLRSQAGDARTWLEKARPRFGTHPRFHSMEIGILYREGSAPEAIEYAVAKSAAMEKFGLTEFYLAMSRIKLGEAILAAPHFAYCESFAEIDMDHAAYTAALYAHTGERDKAFHYLERAVALGNDTLTLYSDPEMLGPLHSDPRWEPFIDGVRRRVAQWRREFAWPISGSPK